MNVEIYKKMRIWENIRKFEIEDRTHKIKGTKPEPNIWEEGFHLYTEEAVDEDWRFKKSIPHAKEIEEELLKIGIDVEYIVTNAYTELKRGFWLHNYYIEENKIEFGGYEYQSYEGDRSRKKEREKYNSMEEAVAGILSFYYYLSNLETAEEVLQKKWIM
ncbi:hypothetical protein ACIFOE_25740 [Paenibacillus sp. NRS-1783]|uniref:hypothetical protein n=1 Tax=Paenibacillus sp. NRS-1783 TaxID=3233907 RepID=UPI003D271A1E